MKFFTYQRLCVIVLFYAFSALFYATTIFYEDKGIKSKPEGVDLRYQILSEEPFLLP
jgi:hypothetical protein